MTPESFIDTWASSQASERANYALFITQLCQMLDVPEPNPSTGIDADNAYVFERSLAVSDDVKSTTNFIDCYKRSHFVLEAKQGSQAQTTQDLIALPKTKRGTARRGTASWDAAMVKARGQAEHYARSLPASEGRPPFLIVTDIGHSIELYAEFTMTGGMYRPFPNPSAHRIMLEDLRKPEIRTRLRQVWLEPLSLDPSSVTKAVTKEIAQQLAVLTKSLEQDHDAGTVADFLMKMIFTFFAEDMKLLPEGRFSAYLASIRGNAAHFKQYIEPLWQTMNLGGFSPQFQRQLLHFNGGLFSDPSALNLTEQQLELLIVAGERDWKNVEPAIFGTLTEQSLNQHQRSELGAHYTPRGHVERIVEKTVLEPLRERWAATQIEFANEMQTIAKLESGAVNSKSAQDTLLKIRVANARCDP